MPLVEVMIDAYRCDVPQINSVECRLKTACLSLDTYLSYLHPHENLPCLNTFVDSALPAPILFVKLEKH